MKILLTSCLFGIWLVSCNQEATKSSNKDLELPSYENKSVTDKPQRSTSDDNVLPTESKMLLSKYLLKGKITNVTVNKEGSVEILVTEIARGKYKCEGKCDEISLFGRFECYGEKYENRNFPNSLSIKFDGQVKFGDGDGSGFRPGTKATFACNIKIFTDNATGDYAIGEIPNSSWSEKKQNGLLDLVIKSKSQYLAN